MNKLFEMRLEQIKSTPQEVRDFMATTVYQDFCLNVSQLIEQQRDDLEDMNERRSGRSYDFIRGALWTLRTMGDIFEIMQEEAETINKKS